MVPLVLQVTQMRLGAWHPILPLALVMLILDCDSSMHCGLHL